MLGFLLDWGDGTGRGRSHLSCSRTCFLAGARGGSWVMAAPGAGWAAVLWDGPRGLDHAAPRGAWAATGLSRGTSPHRGLQPALWLLFPLGGLLCPGNGVLWSTGGQDHRGGPGVVAVWGQEGKMAAEIVGADREGPWRGAVAGDRQSPKFTGCKPGAQGGRRCFCRQAGTAPSHHPDTAREASQGLCTRNEASCGLGASWGPRRPAADPWRDPLLPAASPLPGPCWPRGLRPGR